MHSMVHKERVGLIVETRQGILLVKEKKDIHIQQDRKSLRNAFFQLNGSLDSVLKGTAIFRISQESLAILTYLADQ